MLFVSFCLSLRSSTGISQSRAARASKSSKHSSRLKMMAAHRHAKFRVGRWNKVVCDISALNRLNPILLWSECQRVRQG